MQRIDSTVPQVSVRSLDANLGDKQPPYFAFLHPAAYPSTMSATKDTFLISAVVDAYEGETRVFTKSWDRAISRDGV